MFALFKTTNLLARRPHAMRPALASVGSTRFFAKEIIESNLPLIDKAFMAKELELFSKLPKEE